MEFHNRINHLRARLAQPLPGREAQERMAGRVLPMPDEVPENVRRAAVLMALYPHQDALTMLFIRRTQDRGAHSGQIAFPGGRWEPSDADMRTTALRETEEEVGIRPEEAEVLGALTPLYIPVSAFTVHPFVGFLRARPSLHALSPGEVAGVLEIPLRELFSPQHKQQVEVRPSSAPGMVLHVPAYVPRQDAVIWGATAMMLSELEVLFANPLSRPL